MAWSGVEVAVLLAFTILGSDQLVWFDAALVGYLFGLIDLLPQLALAMALIAWTAAFVGFVVTLIRSASPARPAT